MTKMQSLLFGLLMPTHTLHSNMMKNLLILTLLGLAFIKITEADLRPPNFFSTKPITNIFVKFGNGNEDTIKQFRKLKFSSRGEKSFAFVERLKLEAQLTQQNALQLLRSPEFAYSAVTIKEFWITNEIYVRGASKELIRKLETLPEVGSITEEVILQYEDFQTSADVEDVQDWNLRRMEIEEAWNLTQNRGTYVVVATVDAGVRGDHDTIASKRRVEKYWFDAVGQEPYPVDRNHVGTFLMGLLVGDVVGVAPDAQWIACAACDSNQCTEVNLKQCAQFIMAPTDPDGSDPDPNFAPHIVTGSWGARSEIRFIREIIDAWDVSGILPVFPAGGNGQLCQTMAVPGDYENVLGVGVTSRDDSIMETSSRGPSYYDEYRIKPDLTAPGQLIRSAWGRTRFAHTTLSGNAFGAVQVAGVAALLVAQDPTLSFEDIKMYLTETADNDGLADPGRLCGGGSFFPNNHFGYGIVNARKALQALIGATSTSTSFENDSRAKKYYYRN